MRSAVKTMAIKKSDKQDFFTLVEEVNFLTENGNPFPDILLRM
jgi:hypothetical protein